mmetsp:Transcript_141467/g.439714  ORF Transcript_141467/g.439714 Transcript_141467/m.439714 type:complete len:293 (-) Transcript_141467:85-963(-)
MMISLLALFAGARTAAAWGPHGHKIVAQVAQALLSKEEATRVADILGGEDLASVANWADELRDDKAYRWSEKLHFINMPDGKCVFDYSRDCVEDECVAGAILNFTSQVGSEDKDTQLTALKFVTHFVGDIHQPLHVGWTTDKGGNTIEVEEGWSHDRREKLHAVWDSGLIYGIEDSVHVKEEDIAKNLTKELLSGDMQEEFKTWSACLSSADAAGLKACVTTTAKESAKDACTYAYVDAEGKKVVEDEDLDEAYFETRAPVVRSRLAAGGARLAAILKYALKASPSKVTIYA